MVERTERSRYKAGLRSALLPLLVTTIAALLVRISYLASSSGNPFRRNLGLDTEVYDSWARAILSNQGLGEAPFTQAPFFPLILSIVYGVLGQDPVRALWAHLLPGAAAVLLTSWIALRLRGPVAAWIAGGLMALYKPAIFYTGVLLPPTWVVCLTVLTIAAVVRLQDRRDPPRSGAPLQTGLAGMTLGLLTLAQPAALGLAVPALLVLSKTEGRRLKAPGWFALGVILPLAATFMYNGLAGRAWSVVAVNGGINLHIGNGPGANGAYVRPPEMREDRDLLGIEAARRLSVAAGGHDAESDSFGPAEADRFWRGRAVGHVLRNPSETLKLYLRKLLFFFGQYEIPQVESLPFETRYSWLLRLPLPGMAFLTALAVFGGVLLYGRDDTARWLVWSAAALALGVSVFFITARFRLPVAPILAIIAGAGIAEAAGRGGCRGCAPGRYDKVEAIVRRRGRPPDAGLPGARRRRVDLLAATGLAAATGAFLSLNPAGIDRDAVDGQHHFRIGLLLEKEGKPIEAAQAYSKALGLDPTLGKAHINLGTLLARGGDLAGARKHLEQGVAIDRQSAIGLVNLGDLHSVEGRVRDALEAYQRALSIEPDRVPALEGSALMLYELGMVSEATGFLTRVERTAKPGSPPFLRSRNLLAILAERSAAGVGRHWSLDADLRRADMVLARHEAEEAAVLYSYVMESGTNADSRAEAARMLARLANREHHP